MEVYLLFYTFLTLVAPIFSDKYNLIPRQIESWISDANFSTILRLSFPNSRCCNIFVSDIIQDVELLFNQFRKFYPRDYVVKRRLYECQGYFLTGPTDKEIAEAMKKVQSLKTTTEILIIVNNYIQSNSTILNPDLYENANVNIISKSGIWTLAENYIEPRVFRSHTKYDEMVLNYDNIDLKGKRLLVSTINAPPASYFNSTVLQEINGVEMEVYVPDDDSEIDGIEVQLFLILAKRLNFTWIMIKPEGSSKYGQFYNDSYWDGGMLEMVQQKEIDMAFASIWITVMQNKFFNLSTPWGQMSIYFLVPRPRQISSFWALTRPFSISVWLALLSALLMNSFYTCTRAWLDPKFPKRFRNFLITLTTLIGALLGSSVPRNKKTGRFQMLLWQIAGWLIITAYSSSLASRLASLEYEERIDSVRQFLEANLTWGKKGELPQFNDYFDLADPYCAQLPNRYIHVKHDEDLQNFISHGNFAIFGKVVDSNFFPDDYCPNDVLTNYRVMRQEMGRFYTSFVVQPWLLKPVNEILMSLKQTGISNFLLRDVIRRRGDFHLRQVFTEEGGRKKGIAKTLGLTPLAAGFSLLLVGLLISTFVFFFELRSHRKSLQPGVVQLHYYK